MNTTIDEKCSNVTFAFPPGDSLLAGVMASVSSVLGATANLTAIVALLSYPKTRSHITTPFIVSLAASDFVFSSLTLPILALKFFERNWILGQESGFFCQVFPVLFYGCSAITLSNLMSVTINRWVMIYYPSKSDSLFTRRKSKVIIGFCWLLPLLFLTPSLLGVYGKHGVNCVTRSCTIVEQDGRTPKNIFLFTGLTLPCAVLVITNFMIFSKVKMVRKQMEKQLVRTSTIMPKGMKMREQRLTKMMAFIFGCFLLTYMPGAVIKLFVKESSHPTLHVCSYVVNWLSVLMNPAIYVATQERYRTALRLLFRRLCKNLSAGNDSDSGGKLGMSKLRRGSTFRGSISED